MEKTDEYIAKHFDNTFSAKPKIKYDFNIRKMGLKDRKIITHLLDYGITGKRCLDIGPGTGRWLTFLRENRASYLGAIDISQESLDICRRLCDKTQRADIAVEKLDFESNYFDIIISFEVLEHLRNPSNYISEMIRVIKNGGLVMMSTPNLVSLASRIRMFFGLRPMAMTLDETHVRFYRKKDITRLFSDYNVIPKFIPTSISLNPITPKSRFRIPSFGKLSSLDDSLLFMMNIKKNK